MPQGKLIFNLPEENEDFALAQKAGSYVCVIEEMRNFFRKHLKYTEHADSEYVIYQECMDKLSSLAIEYEVEI